MRVALNVYDWQILSSTYAEQIHSSPLNSVVNEQNDWRLFDSISEVGYCSVVLSVVLCSSRL